MISVASICVTTQAKPPASAYSSCNGRTHPADFNIYIDQGILSDVNVVYKKTRNYTILSSCLSACYYDSSCYFFDYNCEKGDCILYQETASRGLALTNLFAKNGHISGFYDFLAKK